MSLNISFNKADKNATLSNRLAVKAFIERSLKKEGLRIERLQYIFCSDKYLLGINKSYLQHDFYTDIISFDLSETKGKLIGEVYISIDRVKDNAKTHKTSLKEELLRVIFHGTLHFCGGNKFGHSIELMKPWKDHGGFCDPLTRLLVDFIDAFQVHEAPENVQEVIPLKHVFPEVRGFKAVGVFWVSLAAVVAQIEGQEAGVHPVQFRGHLHFFSADCKVHQRSAFESEERLFFLGRFVLGEPVKFILFHCVFNRLCEVSFQFGCGNRNAVDEKYQVDRIVVAGGIVDLLHDTQTHLAVILNRGCI